MKGDRRKNQNCLTLTLTQAPLISCMTGPPNMPGRSWIILTPEGCVYVVRENLTTANNALAFTHTSNNSIAL